MSEDGTTQLAGRRGVLTAGRRSVLSVPGDDARRIGQALAAGADEVVIDLEDAVAPADKGRARSVIDGLDWPDRDAGPRLAVRVNGVGTRWCHRDLEAAVGWPIDSVVVPKVEHRGDLTFVERLLDGLELEVQRPGRLQVQALIETAAGLVGLASILDHPDRLSSLILGYADLAASLGRGPAPSSSVWGPAQESVLWHGRAAGLDVVDGPFLGVHDDEPFRAAVGAVAARGFDAKWVIHPRQVGAVNAVFTPSSESVVQARRVLAALDTAAAGGRGAVQLDGQLLDEAMAVAARRTLAQARRG